MSFPSFFFGRETISCLSERWSMEVLPAFFSAPKELLGEVRVLVPTCCCWSLEAASNCVGKHWGVLNMPQPRTGRGTRDWFSFAPIFSASAWSQIVGRHSSAYYSKLNEKLRQKASKKNNQTKKIIFKIKLLAIVFLQIICSCVNLWFCQR